MKRDLAIAGVIGILIGASVYWGASALSEWVVTVVHGLFGVALVFGFALFLSLAEIPLMVFSFRQMARSTTPRLLLAGAFGFYVAFAAVYAALFVILTGEAPSGIILVVLMFVRWVSGVFVR